MRVRWCRNLNYPTMSADSLNWQRPQTRTGLNFAILVARFNNAITGETAGGRAQEAFHKGRGQKASRYSTFLELLSCPSRRKSWPRPSAVGSTPLSHWCAVIRGGMHS